MWLTQSEQLSAWSRTGRMLLAPLVPILAAAIQSFWVVLIRGTHTYQALLNLREGFLGEMWEFVVIQELAAVCLLWPFVRFPVVHRLMALLVLAGCLYVDFFVLTRAVRR